MKNHMVKILGGLVLLSSSIGFAGNVQGNGLLVEALTKNILLQRARLEVLATANGNPLVINNLQNAGHSMASLRKAAMANDISVASNQMTNVPITNRKIVASGVAKELNLSSSDAKTFSSSVTQVAPQSNFLTPLNLLQIYKPVPGGQALKLGTPVINGTLCAPGDSQVIVDARNQVIHIITSSFVLADWEKSLDRKACVLAIPFEKTKNRSLVIQSVDVHGLVAKLGRVSATVNIEAFLVGGQGTPLKQSLVSDSSGSHAQRFMVRSASVMELGQNTTGSILRLNASLVVQGLENHAQGIIALDRITIKYTLK